VGGPPGVPEVATRAAPSEAASLPFNANATSNPSAVLSLRIMLGSPRAYSIRQLSRA
jgi:hypothetical protein